MPFRSEEDEALHALMTLEEMHEWGLHDCASDVECNYCRQLFDSTREEAVEEAVRLGLDVL